MPQSQTKLPQEGYGIRSVWYLKHFGSPLQIHEFKTQVAPRLGVMEFSPRNDDLIQRSFWTYATNGMSERPMPNEFEPKAPALGRMELIAYSQQRSPWIVSLLSDMARYPFENRTGLWMGHTIPVVPEARTMWSGYVIAVPPFESREFSPLAFDWGISPDFVCFGQVVGLIEFEIPFAEQGGGGELARRVQNFRNSSDVFLDLGRRSPMA